MPQSRNDRGLAAVGAGGIDRRAVARPRRAADDAAIDEIGAGRGDDLADADRGLRADRVAVDIDRLSGRCAVKVGARCRASGSASPGGRIDRKKSAPASNARSSAAGVMPAARARSALLALRPASSVRTSAPLSCKRPPDPGPHHALRDDRDDRHDRPPAMETCRSG